MVDGVSSGGRTTWAVEIIDHTLPWAGNQVARSEASAKQKILGDEWKLRGSLGMLAPGVYRARHLRPNQRAYGRPGRSSGSWSTDGMSAHQRAIVTAVRTACLLPDDSGPQRPNRTAREARDWTDAWWWPSAKNAIRRGTDPVGRGLMLANGPSLTADSAPPGRPGPIVGPHWLVPRDGGGWLLWSVRQWVSTTYATPSQDWI